MKINKRFLIIWYSLMIIAALLPCLYFQPLCELRDSILQNSSENQFYSTHVFLKYCFLFGSNLGSSLLLLFSLLGPFMITVGLGNLYINRHQKKQSI
jgi:hypothetical protein